MPHPAASINIGTVANDATGDPIRTMAQKVNGQINPMPGFGWYSVLGNGAVLDGVADDTGALTATDAQALGDTTKPPIFIPAGTLRVTANVTIASDVVFGPGAQIKPDAGIVVTLAGTIHTMGTQHFSDRNSPSVNTIAPSSAFHRIRTDWGDLIDILALGEAQAVTPRIDGQMDLGIGDLGYFLRRIQFAIAGPIKLTTTGVTGSITSVQNTANQFTDSTKAWSPNVWDPSPHFSYIVKMLTGAEAGHWRYIASNTATQITTGLDFFVGTYGPLAIGDTYEIFSVTLQQAVQDILELQHATDEDGNPLNPEARFNETAIDTGFALKFGRYNGIAGRNFVKVVPAGGGVFDLHIGEDSGMWRHLTLGTANNDPGLELHFDGSWALVDVVCGKQAVLPTNANAGYLQIPACAGTPTGTPPVFTGKVAMVADTVNNKVYAYINGAWRAFM